MTWRRTGIRSEALLPGVPQEVLVETRPVLLVHHLGQIHATSGRCTHAGGELAKGKLQGNRLICPRHDATFELSSGIVLRGPLGMGHTAQLPIFKTKVEDGEIWVDTP